MQKAVFVPDQQALRDSGVISYEETQIACATRYVELSPRSWARHLKNLACDCVRQSSAGAFALIKFAQGCF
jgi:hypothetical protein